MLKFLLDGRKNGQPQMKIIFADTLEAAVDKVGRYPYSWDRIDCTCGPLTEDQFKDLTSEYDLRLLDA